LLDFSKEIPHDGTVYVYVGYLEELRRQITKINLTLFGVYEYYNEQLLKSEKQFCCTQKNRFNLQSAE